LKKILISEEVNFILKKLEENNFNACIVGGCVRDFLLNQQPNDWDIATNAKPNQIKNIFYKTIDTGIKHGTVTVIINKKSFEVTTYRIDGEYKDKRRPENVFFTDDLIKDLSRRDFTINAIAYSKKFIDPFDGISDIKNKIIRCVGDANLRFREDALRMLRALRFAVKLNFLIEEKTYEALIKNLSLIKFVSIERIRDELIKLLSSKNLSNIFLLTKSKILKFINLDLEKYFDSNIKLIKTNLEKLNSKDKQDLVILFSVLFFQLESHKVYDILKFLKLDNKTCKDTKILIDSLKYDLNLNIYFIKKIIFNIGWNNFYRLIIIKRNITDDELKIKLINDIKLISEKISHEPIFLKDLVINGDDIKKLHIEEKKIGCVLENLLDEVHKDPQKNSRKELIDMARKYIML
jgi:tRNA nucleotidyltransferase (CCA-adding enzyme)